MKSVILIACILLLINTTKDFMNYNYACYECYVSTALQMDNNKRKGISTMAS